MLELAFLKQNLIFSIVIRILKKIILYFFFFSILTTIVYRFVPVYLTPLMLINWWEEGFSSENFWNKTWVPYQEISVHVKKAAIASEDQNFCSHFGFDLDAIKLAVKENKKSGIKRGASTISQQVAKNVFLFPSRSWFRKGLEAYFTILIELIWDKKRILEVYLNVAEMGKDTYGIEAAAQKYYKKSALDLNQTQSALIIACLPSPIKWSPTKGGAIVWTRHNHIVYFSRTLPKNYFDAILD